MQSQTIDNYDHGQPVEWLWSTPLYIGSINNSTQLNDLLLDSVGNYKSLPKVDHRFDGALLEHDFFHNPSGSRAKLLEIIHESIVKINTSFPLAESNKFDVAGWFLACEEGGTVPPHSHPNSIWSGVYYLKTSESKSRRSGKLELIDPRGGVDYFVAPGRPFSRSLFISPKAGMLVIFPSWLRHYVHPNSGSDVRISIPFNATNAKI